MYDVEIALYSDCSVRVKLHAENDPAKRDAAA